MKQKLSKKWMSHDDLLMLALGTDSQGIDQGEDMKNQWMKMFGSMFDAGEDAMGSMQKGAQGSNVSGQGVDMSSMMNMGKASGAGSSTGGFDFSSMMNMGGGGSGMEGMSGTGGAGGMGGGAGGGYLQAYNMSSGLAKSLSMSAISSLADTIANRGKEYRPITNNTHRVMAAGGRVGGVPIEVEGDEVAETPMGEVKEYDGPSHEAGGIQTTEPAGTKIYSDRISVDGKTMAQRKKGRERALKRLAKMQEKNPGDFITKKTIEKTALNHAAEEAHDLAIQEAAANAANMNKRQQLGNQINFGEFQEQNPGDPETQMNGWNNSLKAGGIKKFAGGTGTWGVDTGEDWFTKFMEQNTNKTLPGPVKPADRSWMYPVGRMQTPMGPTISKEDMYPEAAADAEFYTPGQVGTAKANPVLPEEDDELLSPPTAGDQLGTEGLAMGAAGPLMTTLANRAGDTPNVNTFANYGKEAIKSMNDAEALVKSSKYQDLADILLQENALRASTRNSTRSLGTIRANNIASAMAAGKLREGASSNYAKEMMNLFGMDATLHNQSELYADTYEDQKNINDKKDRDNFYTNLNSDLNNISEKMQTAGKNKNVQQENEDFLELLPELNKYGLGAKRDKKGKLVITKVK